MTGAIAVWGILDTEGLATAATEAVAVQFSSRSWFIWSRVAVVPHLRCCFIDQGLSSLALPQHSDGPNSDSTEPGALVNFFRPKAREVHVAVVQRRRALHVVLTSALAKLRRSGWHSHQGPLRAVARDFPGFLWVEECGAVPEALALPIFYISAQSFQISGQHPLF